MILFFWLLSSFSKSPDELKKNSKRPNLRTLTIEYNSLSVIFLLNVVQGSCII